MAKLKVALEVGPKKTFATALDWPGWSRSDKTEQAAIESLLAYVDRYETVARGAGLELPSSIDVDVVERLKGGGATDFGVPGEIADYERRPATPKEAERLISLLESSWNVLADVYEMTPETLRKGPRGGGRDRDKMYSHVIDAECAYARTIGVKVRQPAIDDLDAINDARDQMVEALRAARDGKTATPKGWPMRYATRRMAWHVLDHAWEMQDKSD